MLCKYINTLTTFANTFVSNGQRFIIDRRGIPT